MKIKFSTYQNNQINSLLRSFDKNSTNNENNNITNKKDQLYSLYEIFENIYQKNAKYYFANLFIEPIIFYNQKEDIYLPIFDFSFWEYVFLDKSNHFEIEKYITTKYELHYVLQPNQYFIGFYKKNQYIFDFILTIFKEKNQENILLEGGSSINVDLREKLKKNTYYMDYIISDFAHDFLDRSRTKLSEVSYQKIKNIIPEYKSESAFFSNVFENIIQKKLLNTDFKICNKKRDVGIQFYKLLRKIYQYNNGNIYIIEDAHAISFFYLTKEDLQEIQNSFHFQTLCTVGVYMDPATHIQKSENKNRSIEAIYGSDDHIESIQIYYTQICKALFNNSFSEIGLTITNISSTGFTIYSPFTNAFFRKGENTVSSISRFLDYIISNKFAYQSIEEKLKNEGEMIKKAKKDLQQEKNKLKKMKIDDSEISKKNIELKEWSQKYNTKLYNHQWMYTTNNDLFISAMTYIFITNDFFFYKLDKNIQKMICDFLSELSYTDQTIYSELKKYKVRKNIFHYTNIKDIPFTISLFEKNEYITFVYDFFKKNIDKDSSGLLFQIVLFFSRFKLIGDLLQLIEVDKSFVEYRLNKYKKKNGYLITQDRMLGSYSATYENANFICKNTFNNNIYLFYRI